MTSLKYLTVARGLSICLVVLGHSPLASRYQFNEYLGVLRMPFFFILAGVFYSFKPVNNNFFAFAKGKFFALLTPYFFVLSCVGIVRIALSDDLAFDYIKGVLYANGQTIPWTPLWFLPHLFLIYFLAGLFYHEKPTTLSSLFGSLVFLIILLPVFGWIFDLINFLRLGAVGYYIQSGLPWGLDFLLVSFGYFSFGFYAAFFLPKIKFSLLYFFVSLFLFVVLVFFTNTETDLNLRVYKNPLISPVIVCFGVVAILNLSIFISGFSCVSKIFVMCGSFSLYILIFHIFFLNFFSKLGFFDSLTFIFSVLLSIFIGVLVRRINFILVFFEPRKVF